MRITLLALLSLLAADSVNAMRLEEPKAINLLFGYSGREGRRPSMEDKEVAFYPFADSNQFGFFAVYDGHGGIQAAEYAANNLHKLLLRQIKTKKVIDEQLFIDTFDQTEKGIDDAKIPKSGTTAVVSLIENNNLHLAWAGDARAIVIRKGEVIETTKDHKPDYSRKDERARIERAGGKLEEIGVWRVDKLAVSRALGDISKKREHPGAIIATPEYINRTLENGDLIILACDGLWDPFINRVVAEKVAELLKMSNKQLLDAYPAEAPDHHNDEDKPTGRKEVIAEGGNDTRFTLIARGLRDEAIKNGSKDNVSVLVVQYKEEMPKPVEKEKAPVVEKPPVVPEQKKVPGVWPETKISNLMFINDISKGAKMTILRDNRQIHEHIFEKDYANYPLDKQFKQGDSINFFDRDNKPLGTYIVSGNHPVIDIIINSFERRIKVPAVKTKATFLRNIGAVNMPKGITLTIKKEVGKDFGPIALDNGTFGINTLLESTDKVIITGTSKVPIEYSPTGDHIVLDFYLDGEKWILGKIPVVSKK